MELISLRRESNDRLDLLKCDLKASHNLVFMTPPFFSAVINNDRSCLLPPDAEVGRQLNIEITLKSTQCI